MIFRSIFCFKCFTKGDSLGNSRFIRAPEPTDIFWDHLHVKEIQRVFRVLATFFVSFILLVICFLIIYGLQTSNREVKGDGEEGNSQ